MALDYEVRPEYKSLPISKLLDTTVTCFEGVGDTQQSMLNRYFGVTTVRQLANFPFFLWALGIQENALRAGESGGKSVEELSSSEALKFSISPNARGKSPRELLKAPVNVLEGITPGQNLALYDAFRITNVIQLAHNRIMLEARVIEYLENHADAATSEGGPSKSEIASILGTDTVVPGSGDEAQQAISGGGQDDGLRRMANEIGEHVRGRIDALKDRAAGRAREFTTTMTGSASGQGRDITSGIRPERPNTSGDRLSAIREMRERTESTRIQATPRGVTSAAERAAAIAESRFGPSTGAATGTGVASSAGSGMAPAETDEMAGGMASSAASDRGGLSTTPSMTIRPMGMGEDSDTLDAEVLEEGTELTGEFISPERETTSAFKPWMAAAAVVLIVLIVALWMLMSGGGEQGDGVQTAQTGSETAQTGSETAQTPPPPPGGAVTPGAGEQQGTGSPVAGSTESAATASSTPQRPAAQVRRVHSVAKGESLWRISRREYGKGSLWPKIYDMNTDQIEDPDLIFPNQKFKLPELD